MSWRYGNFLKMGK